MKQTTYSSELKNPLDLTDIEISRWHEIQACTAHLQKAFLSYTFCQSVASVHPFVYVCIIKRNRDIVGFFPFQFKDKFHQKIKIAERVGGELSDYFGIIAVPNFFVSMKELSKLCNINFMHYTHLDQTQTDYGFPEESPETGLLIKITNSSEEYFQQLKQNNNSFISDTARRKRKIEKDIGSLKLSFNIPHQDREIVIEELIRKKRAQYLRTKVHDSLHEEWKRKLLHNLVLRNTDIDCKSVLSTLYAGNTWVASHLGLQCGNLLHFWFPVYNQEMAKYSPGRLLMQLIISEAFTQNPIITTIDRGVGVTKAKTDFSNAEHFFLRGNIYNKSICSFSYRLFCSLKWRIQKKI